MSLRLLPLKIKNSLERRKKMKSLKGDAVECVLCNQKFREFMAFGVPPAEVRSNAQCPSCKSLERTRIYWHFLSSKPNFLKTDIKVLHTAPEASLFKKFLGLKNIKYYPIDKFAPGYSYPAPTRNMDITSLDFEDDYFDFILSSHVLEHVIEDRKAMKEFYRVLKPGGFGLLQVPIEFDRELTYEDDTIQSPEEREKEFGQYDHVRIYGRDYLDRLKEAGFKVDLIDYTNGMSEKEIFRLGFGEKEMLFLVTKNATS